jgi:hypothetical protein
MARKTLFIFTLALIFATSLLGATKGDFQAGKFLKVTTDDQVTKKETIRTAVFTVEVGDLIFTARGERVHPKTGDLGEGLIVGDPVQALVDGDKLILLKPDGKELKLKITKRERASQ